jgi:lipopolysaccharide export LptBFGC system permease protein LptF
MVECTQDGALRALPWADGCNPLGVVRHPQQATSENLPVRDHLPEDPDYFRGDVRLPREMSYRELRSYLEDLRQIGGQEVPLLEVELHNKIAYPAITVVMALVALPFAFRLGRRGALYGIGLSLVLGIVLMVFLAIFSALGQAAILPPLVAVWSPSILFAIFSLYLFLGVRT